MLFLSGRFLRQVTSGVMQRQSPKTPSPILVHLDDALDAVLPDDEVAKLEAHDAEVGVTTSHHDFERCYRCAEWAVDLVSMPEHSHLEHLVHRLRAVLHEIHDTDWAAKMGVRVTHDPILDVEIEWVDDAVAVANEVAKKSGWSSVPWEQLLEELIAMEPSK
jgi:hypothetical protein